MGLVERRYLICLTSNGMRTRTALGLVVTVVALTAAGISIWILRQPLRESITALQREVPTIGSRVRLAVVGDNHGDNPVYRQILEEISGQSLDGLLNLADTSEDGTPEEFAAVIALESKLPFPVYHTVGSHDIKADPTRRTFTTAFGTNPCTSATIKNVHLVLLDNADRKVGFPPDCLDWLSTDLATHQDQSVIIAYHRPFDLPLGQVVGDDETAASRVTNRRFKSIIAAYPIKYLFSAHLHTYLPYTLDGIPAVVSGGGGDPAQTVLGGPSNSLFHYLIVTIQDGVVDVDVQRVQLRDNG